MSSRDRGCNYVFDPEDPGTWGGGEGDLSRPRGKEMGKILNENGRWTCPHDAAEGEELCVFHLPVDRKDDQKVVDEFLNRLAEASGPPRDEAERRKLQFVGAEFGDFDLSECHSGLSVEEGEIFLSCAAFAGNVTWFSEPLNLAHVHFEGASFGSSTDFSHATVAANVNFDRTMFGAKADFSSTAFGGYTSFQLTTFRDGADFSDAVFRGLTSFEGVEFKDKVDFERVTFRAVTDPERLKIEDIDTRFTRATFQSGPLFRKAVFEGNTDFRQVEFHAANFAHAEFKGDVFFRSSECKEAAEFSDAVFSSTASFSRFDIGLGGDDLLDESAGTASFLRAQFDGEIDFRGANLEHASLSRIDLTDARFGGARLCNANLEATLLSRSNLSGADLRGAKLSQAVLGDVQINDSTTFLGHPSEDTDTSPHTFSAIRSRPTCVYDPHYGPDQESNEESDVDKAKSVYRTLEELGSRAARPRLQARCFVRRQDLHKDGYEQDVKTANSWEERLIASARYSRAKVARATLLYGESPWRVIAYSLGIILGFALLFPLGGWMKPESGSPITYAQIVSNPVEFANSVYYSTLTFTALGFGDFRPVGFGRVLTTIETGLGAVLLALLVFILGRRAAR